MRCHSLSRRCDARNTCARECVGTHVGMPYISFLSPALSLVLVLPSRVSTHKQTTAVKRRNAFTAPLPINRHCCRAFIILITHFFLRYHVTVYHCDSLTTHSYPAYVAPPSFEERRIMPEICLFYDFTGSSFFLGLLRTSNLLVRNLCDKKRKVKIFFHRLFIRFSQYSG